MEPPSRRWLIAVFCLHFVLGLLMMGSGVNPVQAPDAGDRVALSAVNPGNDAAFDAPHGLSDHQPDLPDSLQRRLPQRQSGLVAALAPSYRIKHLPTPALSLPIKPPQWA